MFKKESMSPVSVAALGGQPIKSEAELIGKYARVLIMPGRPVMADQLMDAPDNIITRKIRPGYRAVTVQVNNVSGIEGWGLPGTRVDVLWATESAEDKVVTTIVKGAQILSVSGKTEVPPPNQQALPGAPAVAKGLLVPQPAASPDRAWTVTLLVTPDDGQKIFLASNSGELSLMLRGDFDGNQEAAMTQQSFTTKRLLQGGADSKGQAERVEGVAKARRPDGSTEEWSVIEGRVWRWDQGQGSTWAQ
jgi:Flp pilus assembly protein CpaB